MIKKFDEQEWYIAMIKYIQKNIEWKRFEETYIWRQTKLSTWYEKFESINIV